MDVMHQSLQVQADGAVLDGDLDLPTDARGVVLFAHGSGSGRHSPRNRYVAGELQSAGLATLLADLLTREEEQADARTAEFRFDIPLLATRLVALADWLGGNEPTSRLDLGLFGASTGAAAAMICAARRADRIGAVVSRGGRPDLAGDHLADVRQPTLLIVGGRDHSVVELNREAMEQVGGTSRLEIVPGATHLFEEPGALEEVARLAREWFLRNLRPAPLGRVTRRTGRGF